ncbi:hypothetical protein IPG36_06445 [bacterium]|nr:MAG: hypothetical protein IPG36_06445 [bacterium]
MTDEQKPAGIGCGRSKASIQRIILIMVFYNQRGGGRIYTNGSPFGFSATWPFSRLIVARDEVIFSITGKKYNFKHADIEQIRISRLGYVVFCVGFHTYWFTSTSIDKIVGALQSSGLTIADDELKKLGFVRWLIRIEYGYLALFLTVWSLGMLYGLSLILKKIAG